MVIHNSDPRFVEERGELYIGSQLHVFNTLGFHLTVERPVSAGAKGVYVGGYHFLAGTFCEHIGNFFT
jgi:hypothetical protein